MPLSTPVTTRSGLATGVTASPIGETCKCRHRLVRPAARPDKAPGGRCDPAAAAVSGHRPDLHRSKEHSLAPSARPERRGCAPRRGRTHPRRLRHRLDAATAQLQRRDQLVDVALAGGVFRIPHTNSAAHRPEPRAEPTFTCAGVLVRISRPIRDAVEAVTHTAELPTISAGVRWCHWTCCHIW